MNIDIDAVKESCMDFLSSVPIIKHFVEHPKEVCMDYLSHFQFAFYMAQLHLYGAFTSLVHAGFPWLYSSEVSILNKRIAKLLEESGCRKQP
jgi:hypothetical protein